MPKSIPKSKSTSKSASKHAANSSKTAMKANKQKANKQNANKQNAKSKSATQKQIMSGGAAAKKAKQAAKGKTVSPGVAAKGAQKANRKADPKSSPRSAGKKSVSVQAKSKKMSRKPQAPKAATKQASSKTAARSDSRSAQRNKIHSVSQSSGQQKQQQKQNSMGKSGVGADIIKLAPLREQKLSRSAIAKIFTPLDDRILIERAEVADRTAGGLFIPDTATSVERPNQGKVLAVGRGHLDKKGRVRPLDVRLGDTVLFAPYSGSELHLNGVDFLVLRESEVIAVLERE